MNGVLGWDIGGVNTKVARVADAQLLAARAAPYALQRDPAALAPLLAHLAHDLGAGPADAHAVTMTAELSQLFRTKREGVGFVLDAVAAAFPDARVRVWSVDARWRTPAEARREPLAVAAANWAATAHVVGRLCADCLLVDVGSTTTDIIPIQGGAPMARGRTDIGVIADALWDAQVARIGQGLERVRARQPALARVVVTGLGEFLGAAAARRIGLHVTHLSDALGPAARQARRLRAGDRSADRFPSRPPARGASGRRTVRRRGPRNVQARQDRGRRGALDGGARDGPVRARPRRPPPRGRAGRRRRRDRRGPPGHAATGARAIPLAPGRGSAPAFLGGHERQHRRLAGRPARRAARGVDQAGARRSEKSRRLVLPTHAPARRGASHRHRGRSRAARRRAPGGRPARPAHEGWAPRRLRLAAERPGCAIPGPAVPRRTRRPARPRHRRPARVPARTPRRKGRRRVPRTTPRRAPRRPRRPPTRRSRS